LRSKYDTGKETVSTEKEKALPISSLFDGADNSTDDENPFSAEDLSSSSPKTQTVWLSNPGNEADYNKESPSTVVCWRNYLRERLPSLSFWSSKISSQQEEPVTPPQDYQQSAAAANTSHISIPSKD